MSASPKKPAADAALSTESIPAHPALLEEYVGLLNQDHAAQRSLAHFATQLSQIHQEIDRIVSGRLNAERTAKDLMARMENEARLDRHCRWNLDLSAGTFVEIVEDPAGE